MSNFDNTVYNNHDKDNNCSEKDGAIAFILTLLGGLWGLHRFYVGKKGTAIFYLCTLGGFLVGTVIDEILIVMGKFRDKEGKYLKFF